MFQMMGSAKGPGRRLIKLVCLAAHDGHLVMLCSAACVVDRVCIAWHRNKADEEMLLNIQHLIEAPGR